MPVFPPIRPYPTIHTDPRTGDDQCPPPSSLEELGQVRGGEGRREACELVGREDRAGGKSWDGYADHDVSACADEAGRD